MKLIAKVASGIGLILTVAPSVIVFQGAMELDYSQALHAGRYIALVRQCARVDEHGRRGGRALSMSPPGPDAPPAGNDRSRFWWSLAGILLAFLALTHLLVMLSFLLGWRVSPFVAPAALALSLAAVDWLARKEGLGTRERLATPAIAVVIVGISFLLAGAFYDMSWDGLWYHQTAVYQMAHGWDPLSDPCAGSFPTSRTG